jgi:DNA (cytosine-5)-methyltransferase 1
VGRAKLDSINSGPGSFALDDRNGLYVHAVRILRELRPRFFVFENVSGILHLRGRNVAEDVCDAVAEAGYVARCTLLNAAWYGVPQLRERIIIVGAREDLGVVPGFPARRFHAALGRGHLSGAELDRRNWRKPEYFADPRQLPSEYPVGPAVTVAEALDDLPPFRAHLASLQNGHGYRPLRSEFPPVAYAHAPRNWYCLKLRAWNDELISSHVTDHFCRWTPRDYETFARMKPGDRYPIAIQIAEERYQDALALWRKNGGKRPTRRSFVPPYPVGSFPDKWRKLVPEAPSWTITAHLGKDTYSHIHYDASQARSITPREAARLQSFPDAFQFEGNMGDAFRQIGNAVPPLLARELGASVRTVLARVDGRAERSHVVWNAGWKAMLARP